METKIVVVHKVTTHRKYNTKLFLSLMDKAIELLPQGKRLKDISIELKGILKFYIKHTNTYISYLGISEWNDRERLYIRDCSMDCTFVSIVLNKEDE